MFGDNTQESEPRLVAKFESPRLLGREPEGDLEFRQEEKNAREKSVNDNKGGR